jgi:hypothetical protein
LDQRGDVGWRELLRLDHVKARFCRRDGGLDRGDLDHEFLFRTGAPQSRDRGRERLVAEKSAVFGKYEDRLRQAQAVHDGASSLDRGDRETLGARRVLARAGYDNAGDTAVAAVTMSRAAVATPDQISINV